MNLNYSFLCSDELFDRITADIKELIETAQRSQLKPTILLIGRVFLDLGVSRSICQEYKINKISLDLKEFFSSMSQIFQERLLKLMLKCEQEDGFVGSDKNYNIELYFDPDEDYMSLLCIDPITRPVEGDLVDDSGKKILTLSFDKEQLIELLFSNLLN